MNTSTGYIFNFQEHGAFSPEGKVADAMPQTEIDAHNRRLATAEIEAMKTTGRAALYLFKSKDSPLTAGTWDGSRRFMLSSVSRSRNNWSAQRTDVWFTFDGSRWHGVNIGDNDILRCKRTKGSR